jgi:hypothetical protein
MSGQTLRLFLSAGPLPTMELSIPDKGVQGSFSVLAARSLGGGGKSPQRSRRSQKDMGQDEQDFQDYPVHPAILSRSRLLFCLACRA